MNYPFITSLLLMLLINLSQPVLADDTTVFLPPEEAFTLSLESVDETSITLAFTLQPEHYLYADKFRFSSDRGVIIGEPLLPKATQRHDTFSNKIKDTYPSSIHIQLPISHATETFLLKAKAQGCAEAGLCYPPFTQTVEVDPLQLLVSNVTPNKSLDTSPKAHEPTKIVDESTRIGNMLSSGNYAITLLSFFGFGLLLALTPCVFPMIPILSSIIIGQGESISKARALKLSSSYVLGMAVTYSLAGVAAGLSGTMLSAALQNIWVLSGFALIFVVLSLAMFDVYQLQLPAGLQSRISRSAEQKKGGSIFGVSAMGALSALIVGPCIAAPLAGALLYIAQTGDAALGGLALFCLALGMGIPLIAVGVAANSLLPKAGMWMDAVKRVFGVLLLAVAIWLISPVAPPIVVMLSIAGLTLFCGVFLHALDPLPHPSPASKKMGKGIGMVCFIIGLSMLLGVLGGSRDPLQPLNFLQVQAQSTSTSKSAHSEVNFIPVDSIEELSQKIESSTGPILLDFYADWCVSCKEMEAFTFSDGSVQQTMQKFTLLQVDVTDNTEAHKAIMKKYKLFGPPAVIALNTQGNELTRVIGFMGSSDFLGTLQAVLTPVRVSSLTD